VVNQSRFGVQHLLTEVDLGEREPDGDGLVRGERRVVRGLGGHVGFDGVAFGWSARWWRPASGITLCVTCVQLIR
jgi:hypothetical protein